MSGLTTFYENLISWGSKLRSPFLLVLRLFFGYAFFQAGFGKLQNIPGTSAFFESLGLFAPTFFAYLVGSTEMVGGILLLLGLASRFSGLVLSFTMIMAYFLAHYTAVQELFSNPKLFIDQAPFLYLLTALAVLAFGPGIFSLDAIIKRYLLNR